MAGLKEIHTRRSFINCTSKYRTGDRMNKNGISRARGTRGEQEKCIHQFDGEV